MTSLAVLCMIIYTWSTHRKHNNSSIIHVTDLLLIHVINISISLIDYALIVAMLVFTLGALCLLLRYNLGANIKRAFSCNFILK